MSAKRLENAELTTMYSADELTTVQNLRYGLTDCSSSPMICLSYCFQRVLAIAILSVCLSVCLSVRHTGGSVKNGAS